MTGLADSNVVIANRASLQDAPWLTGWDGQRLCSYSGKFLLPESSLLNSSLNPMVPWHPLREEHPPGPPGKLLTQPPFLGGVCTEGRTWVTGHLLLSDRLSVQPRLLSLQS